MPPRLQGLGCTYRPDQCRVAAWEPLWWVQKLHHTPQSSSLASYSHRVIFALAGPVYPLTGLGTSFLW